MIGEAAAELRAIARTATGASGYFPAMYARVTTRVADAIGKGTFVDGERMDAFATAFASYCLRPWRDPDVRPRCWQACFDVADDAGLLIVQHLLLGMNAHINHDLAVAVVDVARARGGDLQSIRPDFDAINDVLADTYTGVIADLDNVSRWTNEVARLGGGRLFNFSLTVARRQAWGAAERLHALGDDDGERARYLADLDALVSVLAYLVTRPPLPVRPLLWLGRRLEEDDHAEVVAALLGDD